MKNYKIPTSVTLAALRSGVLMTLCEVLPHYDEQTRELIPRGRGILSLRAGAVTRKLELTNGSVGEVEAGKFVWPSAMLNFLNVQAMAAKLSGGSGFLIPLPLRNSAIKMLGLFPRLTSRISTLLQAQYSQGEPGWEMQTKLLLSAALRGVCELSIWDPWVAQRKTHLPAGVLRVLVGDPQKPDFQACIFNKKTGGGQSRMELFTEFNKGYNFLLSEGERPTAELIFSSTKTAGEILRGETRAMDALGSGDIRITGKLPFIQNVFPLLDRFSYCMSR